MEKMTVKLVSILIVGVFLGSSLLVPRFVNASPDTLQEWFDDHGYLINVDTDETGIEMFPSGYCEVKVLNGEHGYTNPTGWYTRDDDETETYLLFPEPVNINDTASFTSEESFGFYINSTEGTFFTETNLNLDEFDHALVFNNTKGPGYIVAFEDMLGGGDEDYTDRIIEVAIGSRPNDDVTLFFPPGSEIVEATATETTRYPPPSDGFIGPVWEIKVEGTFEGLARVRLYYGEAETDPTEILQTDIVLGDVNADGEVNFKDLCIIIKALYSRPGRRRWNEYCDLNGDNKINLKDLCIAIDHLGETSEWAPLSNAFVNYELRYIEGDTDHFSIFGAHWGEP